MIGKLWGLVDEVENDYLIMNVNNVGYIVYVTTAILEKYKVGDNLTLFIETYMREDQIKLYGFENKEQLLLLRMLIKVKGVSHKIATNVISEIPTDQILQGIIGKNPTLLRATGVGVKLANRIISELESTIQKQGVKLDDNLTCDAISALINLGYDTNESYKIVSKIRNQGPEINNINELIRRVLQENERK